jgi:putative restriction endonuclease
MTGIMDDPDADIRAAAFSRLRTLVQAYGGALPWSALSGGFTARDCRVLFASAAEGIFRPVGMSGVLSLKTVVPKLRGRIWYHDQASPELRSSSDTFSYAFTGQDAGNTRNQWLRDAMVRQLPLIYFYGVAPAAYEPLFPAYVVEWNPDTLSCSLSFSTAADLAAAAPPQASERRYALRTIQQRLHQAMFRERVLAAYGRRCALSGLPEARLIDAAHIAPDSDERLGQPDVRNGICMSKIHHAAFDAGLIGIDPDLRIHISPQLLEMNDGPLLEQGLKALAGSRIRVPRDPLAVPDRERLANRFELFLASL